METAWKLPLRDEFLIDTANLGGCRTLLTEYVLPRELRLIGFVP
jgi:hypothetical protein